MSLTTTNSTQFTIKELSIVTKSNEEVDIRGIFDEINIFDSLFLPVMSGNILITDSTGLSGKIIFDGSESLKVNIVKDDDSDIAIIKKAFRIYKQTDKKNEGLNTLRYILHFTSDEFFYSHQQKVNKSYDMTYRQVVDRILIDYLKVPQNNLGGLYEESMGIRQIVVPNLPPLDACEWCAKRSVDFKNSPNFLFFQNSIGYNFATLSTLLTQDSILDIKFTMKNIDENSLNEISNARKLEVVSQVDAIKQITSGVNSGKFIGFDPMTGTISSKNISYADHYDAMTHGNENPNISVLTNRDNKTNLEMNDSFKTVSIFGSAQKNSKYIQSREPESLSKLDDTENYKFQRKAIINNLMNRRVRLVMPGNFQLTSGLNVNLNAKRFGEMEDGGDNNDNTLSGKYIIIGSRQVIGFHKHETFIEIATTSTVNPFIPASNPAQTQSILEY